MSTTPDKTAQASDTADATRLALGEVARRHALLIHAQQEVARTEDDLDTTLAIVARYAQEITGASGAVVEMADGPDMVYRATSGTATQHLGLRLQRAGSLSGCCVQEGRPLTCEDTETDTRVDRNACHRVGVRSMTVVPVQQDQATIGVLKVYSDRPHGFAEEDTATLQLMVGTIVTATSRLAERQARQALRVQDERLRLAVEGAEIGAWHWELPSNAQEWSDKCKEILGLPPDAPSGYEQFQACVHPDDYERVRAEIAHAVATRSDIANEYRIVWPDGSVHWIAGRGRVYCDSLGTPRRFEGIVQNIDIRKRSEAAAQQHQAELEAMNKRLQRAMQETHHRVKNNLQVIAALIDFHVSNYPEFVPTTELGKLGLQVSVLATLHDVLTETVKTQSEAELVSAEAIINNLGPLLKRVLPRNVLHFYWEDLPLTVRQGASVALLINELVTNAGKHGGTEIWVTLGRKEAHADLEVSDDGPGFFPKFDGKQHARRGLELVQSLVDWDLRGEIRWENRRQGGASVRVRFPLVPPHA